ncbi:MAG: methionine--tRNA ligase [Lentisphaerae bacterium]|nr:methionine--tRNA ligase [Lentisphaerota bacterium]
MSIGKFYITTPIYYVNDRPHIGHAYTTILADVLARYHRLLGDRVFFLTGTDEHGQKVQRAAEKAGISPKKHADETVVRFLELWEKLGITNDSFIRTTDGFHKDIVSSVLNDLLEKGDIYKASYDGWYCVTCERFFADKDVVDEKCPEEGCGRKVERLTETNYFFRLSNYQDWLIEYINANPKFIQPDFRRNETLGFLRNKLNDLCISRPKSRLAWGIDLPFDSDFVTYVWFDALLNYVSAIGYKTDDAGFNSWWPASYHLIGKDILTTHTVYWPAMLKAMGLPMPETVFAHGWWLIDKCKMSKSVGNVVNPIEMADKYGVDEFRYYLMAEMTLGQDANFSEDSFVRRYNDILANDLGNFISRTLKFVEGNFAGKIPVPGEYTDTDNVLRATASETIGEVEKYITEMRLDLALGSVAALMRDANRYFDHEQPWTLAKTGQTERLQTVIYTSCEVLRVTAGLLYPVMPVKMDELALMLGVSGGAPDINGLRAWGGLEPGIAIGGSKILFPRLKNEQVPTVAPKKEEEREDLIDYSDFAKVRLLTAKVLSAESVANTDKLLKLSIEVGDEVRQLVAGVAKSYEPEQLIGKTIVIVSNLKPAKIRGIVSEGMLLAASDGDSLRLLTVDGDVPSGSSVQ